MKIEFNTNNESETREYSLEKMIILQGKQYHNNGSESQFSEDVSVTITKNSTSEIIANVLRTNHKKNWKRFCDNPIDHYFIKSAQPLYKLELRLLPDGKIDTVLNRNEVLKQWEYTKLYLDKYFVSEDNRIIDQLNRWTDQIEQQIVDEQLFMDLVCNNLFYGVFFNGYWKDYGDENRIIIDQSFPFLFGSSKLILTEDIKVTKKTDGVSLSVTGTFNKKESDVLAISQYLDVEEKDVDNLIVDLETNYLIDKNGLIDSVDLYIFAELDGSDFKKQCGLKIKKK